MALDRMSKGRVRVDPIDVTAPGSISPKHAGVLKIGQNLCDGSLGYADPIGQVANAQFGISRERDEHVSVIAQEGPCPARLHRSNVLLEMWYSCL